MSYGSCVTARIKFETMLAWGLTSTPIRARTILMFPMVRARLKLTWVRKPFNPPKSALTDFTLSNARRFYSSKGDPLFRAPIDLALIIPRANFYKQIRGTLFLCTCEKNVKKRQSLNGFLMQRGVLLEVFGLEPNPQLYYKCNQYLFGSLRWHNRRIWSSHGFMARPVSEPGTVPPKLIKNGTLKIRHVRY